jgi:hypothetical protein
MFWSLQPNGLAASNPVGLWNEVNLVRLNLRDNLTARIWWIAADVSGNDPATSLVGNRNSIF